MTSRALWARSLTPGAQDLTPPPSSPSSREDVLEALLQQDIQDEKVVRGAPGGKGSIWPPFCHSTRETLARLGIIWSNR